MLREKLQIERAINRDCITEMEVKQILVSQATRDQRLQMADDVIVNDRDLDFLAEEVKQMHALYLEFAANGDNCRE